MLPREVELVSELIGLSGGMGGKHFERSNGLDTALFNNAHVYMNLS